MPVLCAQRGLCPLRLLTSWRLWSRLSSSQEVFAKSKTLLRKRSVGSRGVASLYLMRSERTQKPSNGSLSLESLAIYCCHVPELSFKEDFVAAGSRPSLQSKVQLGMGKPELNVTLSLSISIS